MAKKKARFTTEELKGKFIIAFDTMADGWQCATDEKGRPDPTLFDSEADAMHELFGDALSMLENQTDEDREENEISKEEYAEMKAVFNNGAGDPEQMKNFLDANPHCNYNGEWIENAEEFIFGRKAIFTGNGGHIEGEKLS